jgi:predicted AlkP superfamily phosphohydrolase/phosphomutase
VSAAVLTTVLVLALVFTRRDARPPGETAAPPRKRVVVIGIDGMDFGLTQGLMRDGKLPHLAALGKEGSFLPVQTSMPPLSPVAWSNFITGTNPGGHGVFDFLRRDPAHLGETLTPRDSVTSSPAPDEDGAHLPIPFTRYAWPTSAEAGLLRHGTTLWEVAESCGVPATVYKVPANFPVAPGKAEVLAGMGTPDVEGTYGTFTYFTSRPTDPARPVRGGRVIPVSVVDGEVKVGGAGSLAAPRLTGPVNPFLRPDGGPGQRRVEVPFEVHVDAAEHAAVVSLLGRDVLLNAGEWSPWLEVNFELLPHVKSLRGFTRMYLQEAAPSFQLFVSPVSLAPGTAGLASGGLDETLEDKLGPYFTKGMSEETKALTQGVFTTDEYLKQSDLVLTDSIRAFEFLLGRPRPGLLFVYFSTLDLNCHVLWKHRDPAHPAYDATDSPRHANSISDLYVRLDGVVGRARAAIGPGDVLYVVSDHGFVPMYREFNLQAWLARQGYLAFKPGSAGEEPGTLDRIDWTKTRAYGLGFQSLYLNLKGREAQGIVGAKDADGLAAEIRGKLLALRDDGGSIFRGRRVFQSAYRPSEIYEGSRVSEAPDLILGYAKGYGPSDDTVLGVSGDTVLAPHLGGFSGHHTTDFSAVPGVLFCSRKLNAPRARLEDVTVTVLRDLGAPSAAGMTGRPLE